LHFQDIADQFPETPDYGGLMLIRGEPTNTVENDFLQLAGGTYRAQPGALGNLRRDEEYDLHCLLRCWTGDIDAGATNAVTVVHAFAILDAIQLAITADPNANFAIRYWQMSEVEITEGDEENGWAVSLAFAIHCEATTQQ
jgi:hypothetical protein